MNALINNFLNNLLDRSPLTYPLVSIAHIALIKQSRMTQLFLDYDNVRPIILHPDFHQELTALCSAARDILRVQQIRIDNRHSTAVINCKGNRFIREVAMSELTLEQLFELEKMKIELQDIPIEQARKLALEGARLLMIKDNLIEFLKRGDRTS